MSVLILLNGNYAQRGVSPELITTKEEINQCGKYHLEEIHFNYMLFEY